MRIRIALKPLSGILHLPKHYNYCLQAFFYHLMQKDVSQYVHDNGFACENKRFKMFTFSSILEEGKPNCTLGDNLCFEYTVTILFSTAVTEIGDSILETLEKSNPLNPLSLNRQAVLVGKYTQLPEPDFYSLDTLEKSIKIKLISPLTVYETNEKLVSYPPPFTEDFNRLLLTNAQDKMKVIKGVSFKHHSLSLDSGQFSLKKAIVMYKTDKNPITAWKGHLLLKGSPELISISYQTGLGAKNSQGFGMWKIAE